MGDWILRIVDFRVDGGFVEFLNEDGEVEIIHTVESIIAEWLFDLKGDLGESTLKSKEVVE